MVVAAVAGLKSKSTLGASNLSTPQSQTLSLSQAIASKVFSCSLYSSALRMCVCVCVAATSRMLMLIKITAAAHSLIVGIRYLQL